MTEQVIEVSGMDVIEALSRRTGASTSYPDAENDARARRFGQFLSLTLHMLVALLDAIIVVALAVGHTLGVALRRAQKALANQDPWQNANRMRK